MIVGMLLGYLIFSKSSSAISSNSISKELSDVMSSSWRGGGPFRSKMITLVGLGGFWSVVLWLCPRIFVVFYVASS